MGVFGICKPINDFALENSDIITFHNYADAENLKKQIAELKQHDRPMVCTEYMARKQSSLFCTHLPIFKENHIGSMNWGLVSGKTQTIYPWDYPDNAPEPELWFHDIFRQDGTPFDAKEIECIKNATISSLLLF